MSSPTNEELEESASKNSFEEIPISENTIKEYKRYFRWLGHYYSDKEVLEKIMKDPAPISNDEYMKLERKARLDQQVKEGVIIE